MVSLKDKLLKGHLYIYNCEGADIEYPEDKILIDEKAVMEGWNCICTHTTCMHAGM